METSITQDMEVASNTPLTKNEQDLLGDLSDLDPLTKTEPSLKPVTPEPTKPLTPEPAPVESFDISSKIEPISDPLTGFSDNVVSDVKESSNALPEVKDFLDELKSESKISPEPVKEAAEPFGFNKPLPPEPYDSTADFLKSEVNGASNLLDDKDDDVNDFVGATGDISPAPISREESPLPPPVPKHQNLRDESPDRFESSPEPDFKPMDSGKEIEDIIEPPPSTTVSAPPKQEEPKKIPMKEVKTVDIGAKDIIVEIDAWFNPARLHPQVESLVYWRDPQKSGVVFGVLMVTLLSLTTFSLITVVAYLGLLTLAGTISFRIYKNIMQAVQKTSGGHPFKEYLEMEISLPEDKVAEISRAAAQHVNSAISALRSLFLVEDLVDSIKGLVLFWALTYLGAVFNGLTLLIMGVILLFSLPRLYEKNKSQVDAYIQIGMDKLSIVTNRMKAAIPSGKKEEKPKDQ